MGRFLQADSIIPGAASGVGGGAATLGYDSRTRLTPLTVNLGEFVTQVNAENREILQFGPFFQWDARTRQEHNVPLGPYNPQTLNRYAYVLNNPLRYVDPTGHEVVCLSVILISGVVGGVFSAGGSFMAQMIQGNGDFAQRFQTVDWENVAIAGAVGFAAGALAPVVATTTAAAAILGATANVTQYGLTQWSNNESMTWGGVAVNASVGALTGALISGSFDFQPGSGHYLASGYQWTKSEAAWYNAGDIIVYGLLGASNLSRSLIGGLVDNLEYIR